MTTLPTGTVTFLFTDIEGSTRLLEARPEAYRIALARHDAILTQAIETLQDPNTTFRFDASDLMPGAVNTAFWKQMTDWITGKSTADALSGVEKSWP